MSELRNALRALVEAESRRLAFPADEDDLLRGGVEIQIQAALTKAREVLQ